MYEREARPATPKVIDPSHAGSLVADPRTSTRGPRISAIRRGHLDCGRRTSFLHVCNADGGKTWTPGIHRPDRKSKRLHRSHLGDVFLRGQARRRDNGPSTYFPTRGKE